MGDPRVDAAIAHWAPRYVEDGIPVGDFQEVSRSVERWEDWCAAWAARVYASFKAFYDGVRAYHHISEQAYINARDKVLDAPD